MTPLMKKEIIAAIAIIEKDGLYLIAQRKPGDTLGLYWEFPGGKCEEGETLEECLLREIKEELGITIQIHKKGEVLRAENAGKRVLLHSFYCSHEAGTPQTLECHDFRWVRAEELGQFRFPPANERLTQKLQKRGSLSSITI